MCEGCVSAQVFLRRLAHRDASHAGVIEMMISDVFVLCMTHGCLRHFSAWYQKDDPCSGDEMNQAAAVTSVAADTEAGVMKGQNDWKGEAHNKSSGTTEAHQIADPGEPEVASLRAGSSIASMLRNSCSALR